MKKIVMYLLLVISIVTLSGCKAEEYLVKFEVEDGISVEDVIVIEGETLVAPQLEDIEGYTFYGWFADESYLIIYDFTDEVTSDTTLYAKWVINQYTITYVINSEVVDLITITNVYGFIIYEPVEPIKEGYIFAGWITDSNLNIPFVFGNELTEDITIYATWE